MKKNYRGLRIAPDLLLKEDLCKAGRSEKGSYTYLRPNRAYFPEYGLVDLGGISVGLGARYQSRKIPHLGCGQICQTLVIFLNTEEQILDSYKFKYYPIWTSVSDITFTRCFFGVNL